MDFLIEGKTSQSSLVRTGSKRHEDGFDRSKGRRNLSRSYVLLSLCALQVNAFDWFTNRNERRFSRELIGFRI